MNTADISHDDALTMDPWKIKAGIALLAAAVLLLILLMYVVGSHSPQADTPTIHFVRNAAPTQTDPERPVIAAEPSNRAPRVAEPEAVNRTSEPPSTSGGAVTY